MKNLSLVNNDKSKIIAFLETVILHGFISLICISNGLPHSGKQQFPSSSRTAIPGLELDFLL